jgi:hypothetical protein
MLRHTIVHAGLHRNSAANFTLSEGVKREF